jgi:hypothetical protein
VSARDLSLLFPLLLHAAPSEGQRGRPFLESLAPNPALSASIVPRNGDLNPCGVALVPHGFPGGRIEAGDILVSKFNDASNTQGTGSTIVAFEPTGSVRAEFDVSASLGPVGLTSALAALRSGLIVVGNAPSTDGTPDTISIGSLIFLDPMGRVVLNLIDSALLQGPWDMTADDSDPDQPILYVSNVLGGSVTRINLRVARTPGSVFPQIESLTRVGSGFMARTDPNALVVGPTGLLLSHDRRGLFVADTGNNRIQFLSDVRDARRDRGPGRTIFTGAPLKGPLALAWSPNHTIVASNGDTAQDESTPRNMVVEIDPEERRVVASRQLDSGIAGGIFGIAIGNVLGKASLLFVNDNSITLNVLSEGR